MRNQVNAYQEAVKKFVTLDPEDIVARCGVSFDSEQKRFSVVYFNSLYMVELDGRVWRAEKPEDKVSFNDRTLIIQYLCEASGLPPRGIWLSFLELPDGAHHYQPFITDATGPLAEIFGNSPDRFAAAAEVFGGRPLTMGDSSFYIPALPKIPLAVVLWEGDEEFKARSNILFDSVSPTHLTTAALWVLGVELAHKMIGYYDEVIGREKEITWLEGARRD
jgi:hypothetical protein